MNTGEVFIPLKFEGSDASGIALGSISSKGARPYQEDSFGFSSIKKKDAAAHGFTAVVADGMGGLSDGGAVSKYIVSSLIELSMSCNADLPTDIFLQSALRQINYNVVSTDIKGGSTAVTVKCSRKGIYWCTVGDSRVYLLRYGMLTALNADSDHINTLLDDVISREMTFREVQDDPQKDSLEFYIGCGGTILFDANVRPLVPKKGDKLLLCSDGVYNAVTDSEMIGALDHSAAKAAEKLGVAVAAKGFVNQDNYTAVILEFK